VKDLNAVQIGRLKPGLHRASRGLYVRVTPNGSKAWIHRYHNGKAHEMGLGSVDIVTLAEARDAVIDGRRLLRQGIDPIRARSRPTTQHTFAAVAKLFIDAHWTDWAEKHAKQWPASLRTHVYPVIGDTQIDKLTTGDVLRTLQPIWPTIPKSADNIRGRIAQIWNYAKAMKWVTGDNPAEWRGNLQPLLGDISTIAVEHQPALPWSQMPGFMTA
jgi:Arm DNA-binding domain